MAITWNKAVGFETGGAEELSLVTGSQTYPTGAESGTFYVSALDNFDRFLVAPFDLVSKAAGDLQAFGFRFRRGTGSARLHISPVDAAGGNNAFQILSVDQSAGEYSLKIMDSLSVEIDTSNTTNFSDNTWYRIFIVWENLDSGDVSVYIDNVLEMSGTAKDLLKTDPFGAYRFSASEFDDIVVASGLTSVSDRPVDWEVLPYPNVNTADPSVPDGGAFSTAGTTPAVGLWTAVAETPFSETLQIEYTADPSGGRADSADLGAEIDGDSNTVFFTGIWRLDRDGGAGTTHSVIFGNSGDTDAAVPTETVVLTTSPTTFVFGRNSDLPLKSVPDAVALGFWTGGAQDIHCYDMLGTLLHIPDAGADTDIAVTTDALALAEFAATITLDVDVPASTDALTLAEFAATVDFGFDIAANTDALTLAEFAATIVYDVDVLANTDALVIAEFQATITLDVGVAASLDALVLAEFAATISLGADIAASTDALVLAEFAATIVHDVDVSASVDALVIAEFQATITTGTSISATTDALVLAEFQATISVGVNISATTDTLTLAEFAATVDIQAPFDFGALTLAGEGGIPEPSGSPTITGGTATEYEIISNFVVPKTSGMADAGTIIFSDSTVWAISIIANSYSARDYTQVEELFRITGLDYGQTVFLRDGTYDKSDIDPVRRLGPLAFGGTFVAHSDLDAANYQGKDYTSGTYVTVRPHAGDTVKFENSTNTPANNEEAIYLQSNSLNANGIRWTGITFSRPAVTGSSSSQATFRSGHAGSRNNNITFDNCHFQSPGFVFATNAALNAGIDAYGNDLVVMDCTFDGVSTCIQNDGDNPVFVGNVCQNVWLDLFRIKGGLVTYVQAWNTCYKKDLLSFTPSIAHADFSQVFDHSVDTTLSVVGNRYFSGKTSEGVVPVVGQGIFNEVSDDAVKLTNYVLAGNLLTTDFDSATFQVQVHGMHNFHNTFLNDFGSLFTNTRIRLKNFGAAINMTDISIRNNIVHSLNIEPGDVDDLDSGNNDFSLDFTSTATYTALFDDIKGAGDLTPANIEASLEPKASGPADVADHIPIVGCLPVSGRTAMVDFSARTVDFPFQEAAFTPVLGDLIDVALSAAVEASDQIEGIDAAGTGAECWITGGNSPTMEIRQSDDSTVIIGSIPVGEHHIVYRDEWIHINDTSSGSNNTQFDVVLNIGIQTDTFSHTTVVSGNVLATVDALVLTEFAAVVASTNAAILATTDALALAEFAATITLDVNVGANTDALVIAEFQATIGFGVFIAASTDALAIAEFAAVIALDVDVLANTDALVIAENAATIVYDVDVPASTDALVIAEFQATISVGVNIQANTDALVIAENAATITLDVDVAASADALVIAEFAATVSTGTNIFATTDALVLAEFGSTITHDVEVLAGVDALTLAEFAATVSVVADVAEEEISPTGIGAVVPGDDRRAERAQAKREKRERADKADLERIVREAFATLEPRKAKITKAARGKIARVARKQFDISGLERTFAEIRAEVLRQAIEIERERLRLQEEDDIAVLLMAA